MNHKLSIGLLLVCLGAIFINHFAIDWEEAQHRKAIESLDEIVASQYEDLLDWKDELPTNGSFRKRTVCKGRLDSWSDNRPFVSNIGSDSIQVVENKLGLFLVQQIAEGDCVYISCHQLLKRSLILTLFVALLFRYHK